MKKMYSFLISLICTILVGCGSNKTEVVTVIPEEPTATVTEKTMAAEPAEDISAAESDKEYLVEHDIEDIATVEPLVEYIVDGVFYPIEYARQLGYIIYDSDAHADFCSYKEKNGIECFVIIEETHCQLYYEKDNKCYVTRITDRSAPDRGDTRYKIATGSYEVVKEDSVDYFNNLQSLLSYVAAGTVDPTTWDMPNIYFDMTVYNCSASYDSDGFIDTGAFTNEDPSLGFRYSYK